MILSILAVALELKVWLADWQGPFMESQEGKEELSTVFSSWPADYLEELNAALNLSLALKLGISVTLSLSVYTYVACREAK